MADESFLSRWEKVIKAASREPKPILPLSEQEAWCQFSPREASAEIDRLRAALERLAEMGDQIADAALETSPEYVHHF